MSSYTLKKFLVEKYGSSASKCRVGRLHMILTDVPKSLVRENFEVGNGPLDQPIRILFACSDMLKCSPEFEEFENFDETFRNFDGARRIFYQVK